MKVTLNIADDDELRAHIKHHIQGLYKSVISDEIRAATADIINAKVKSQNQYFWDKVIKDAMIMILKEDLKLRYGSNKRHPEGVLRLAARQALEDYLGDKQTKEELMYAIAKEVTGHA